jgi:hypothetical protein
VSTRTLAGLRRGPSAALSTPDRAPARCVAPGRGRPPEGGFGAMRGLHGLAAASTPASRTVCKRGAGTLVARRQEQRQRAHVHRDRPIAVRAIGHCFGAGTRRRVPGRRWSPPGPPTGPADACPVPFRLPRRRLTVTLRLLRGKRPPSREGRQPRSGPLRHRRRPRRSRAFPGPRRPRARSARRVAAVRSRAA